MSKNIYLAGGIEKERNLGKAWRQLVTPDLHEAGYVILDPCTFEPLQLKGLNLGKLPREVQGEDGTYCYIKSWHDLKYAKKRSRWYQLFERCMEKVIRYDITLVEKSVDAIICLWSPGTAQGAGTHAELTSAFMKGIPVILVQSAADVPAWVLGCCKYGKVVSTLTEAVVELKNILPANE